MSPDQFCGLSVSFADIARKAFGQNATITLAERCFAAALIAMTFFAMQFKCAKDWLRTELVSALNKNSILFELFEFAVFEGKYGGFFANGGDFGVGVFNVQIGSA